MLVDGGVRAWSAAEMPLRHEIALIVTVMSASAFIERHLMQEGEKSAQ